MKDKVEAVRREFDRKAQKITAYHLTKYPEGSYGRQLGRFLMGNNYGQNVYAYNEDALQLLITGNSSFIDEIALQYYLFGNGAFGLRRLIVMLAGVLVLPHKLVLFYNKYKEGRNALRLHDIDQMALLHLPLKKVKDTFLVK